MYDHPIIYVCMFFRIVNYLKLPWSFQLPCNVLEDTMKGKHIGFITTVIRLLLVVCLMFQYEGISDVKAYLPSTRGVKVHSVLNQMAIANSENNNRNAQTLSINQNAAWAIVGVNHSDKSSPYQAYYDEIQCTTEHSNDTCSFPLLTAHHERCGYFAKTTSWQHLNAAYPNPAMTVNTCKVSQLVQWTCVR